MRISRWVIGWIVLMLTPLAASAQVLRGLVVDRTDRPVGGVIVVLVDSASSVAARSLTNERGEYRLAAGRAGVFTVRTLRIGFRPETSDPIALAAGADVTKRITLTGVAFGLDTLRVVSQNVCRNFSQSGAATYAVWEQVRGALTAAQLTSSARAIAVTSVLFERSMLARSRRVRKQSSRVQVGFVAQPWAALSPDSLHRTGYIAKTRDNETIYYAPGLDMLLSDVFVVDHCFRLTSEKERLGVVFEPTRDRRNVPEIRGTLWLDRATSELRSMELRYVNVDSYQEDAGADMEFVRFKEGGWVISRWSIRMPVLEQVVRPQQYGGTQIQVSEVFVTGGEIVLARRGQDTLWAQPPRVLSGRLVDSLSGDDVSNARVKLSGTTLEGTSDDRGRFHIGGVLPGEYTAEVRTVSLDSVSAVHQADITFTDASETHEIRVPTAKQITASVCGSSEQTPGIVFGTVRLRGDSTPPRGALVTAHWTNIGLAESIVGVSVTRDVRHLDTRADAHGLFRLCGVPARTDLTVIAGTDSAEGEPVSTSIPVSGGFARVELPMHRIARALAIFTGTVMIDSTKRPIAGAQVLFPDLGISATTNERGEFRVADVPAGTHKLSVRQLGFGPLDAQVTLLSGQRVEKNVYLSRVSTLETMAVVENALNPSFEEHRRLGLGSFLTREDLAKHDGAALAGALANLRGIQLVSGTGGHVAVANTRVHTFGGSDLKSDTRRGFKLACYAHVYVDNLPVYTGRDGQDIVDLMEYPPERIQSIEFYSNPAQTPAKYSALNSSCGVIVIWTRGLK
ncbi:MAG: carboxypeptidase regulatory-like domain-containing protein [Gemmatimonadota bacterium]